MDIQQLQAFLAVAKHGSFSVAAQELHLTQPAVSKRVAALEAGLDARLFDRIGRQVVITPAGQALKPGAEKIVAEVAESQRALSNLREGISGKLVFATSHHVGLHYLPRVLRMFSRTYPEVDLDIRFMDSELACEAVARGELEFAVTTLPQVVDEPLQATALWHDPLCFCVATDHPLGGAAPPAISQLADYPAILPGLGTYTRMVVEQALAPHGIRANVALSTNYLETIKMLVGVGLGWSALPDTMVGPEMTILEFPSLRLARTLGSIRHRDLTPSAAARAMLALLNEYATMAPHSARTRSGP